MKKLKTVKSIRTNTAEELGKALGLSAAETGEMEFRSDLTYALIRIIRDIKMTHAEIAKKAGSSRTRVTAIANGNTKGISTDLMIRVLSATGHKAELRIRKTAA